MRITLVVSKVEFVAVRLFPLCAILTAAIVAPCADAKELDFRKISCREFLASDQPLKANLIMWLHGYHAGKTGIIPYLSDSPYGARLGVYCKLHPDVVLLDASEQILSDLDRGI